MAIEPKINVYERAQSRQAIPVNIASTVAIIGAFDSEISDLTVSNSVSEAHQKFGTMVTEGNFKGTDAIDGIFTGASTVLFVNITTWDTSGDDPVAETTLTQAKLTAALDKLHHERFNNLFIAEQLTDEFQTIVSAWLDAEFEAKYPHGQISQLQKSSAAAYQTSVDRFNDNIYYINTQQFTVNGTTLSLNRSTAWLVGYICRQAVDTSLTNQVIEGVTAVTPEYSTAAGELGAALLQLNIPFLKSRNRRLQTFYCVNSELPDGYDLYINRTRDLILENIAVETALGQKSNNQTEHGIVTVMEGLIQYYVNDLKLLEGITYHIEKPSSNIINVVIDELLFSDIVNTINIYYTIEVQ